MEVPPHRSTSCISFRTTTPAVRTWRVSPAVFLPDGILETDRIGRLVSRGLGGGGTLERQMRSLCIEVDLEKIQFARQVGGVPEEDLVKELPTHTSDQPFNEPAGHRHMEDRVFVCRFSAFSPFRNS